MLSSFLSSMMFKVFAASVAIATVGAGAGEAAEAHGDGNAAAVLADAAERMRSVEEGQTGPTREPVASLLDLISEQLAGDGVVGEDVAEAARSIGDAVVLPEDVPPVTTPPPAP